MAREQRYGSTLNGWEHLLASLEANAGDFQPLERYRRELAAMLEGARESMAQQAEATARKQAASQRLQGLLVDGRKLATFLRHAARRQYGERSEKLAEFNLQPFRGRPRQIPEAEPPAPPPPAPAEPQK